jgi:hypothetical protein
MTNEEVDSGRVETTSAMQVVTTVQEDTKEGVNEIHKNGPYRGSNRHGNLQGVLLHYQTLTKSIMLTYSKTRVFAFILKAVFRGGQE